MKRWSSGALAAVLVGFGIPSLAATTIYDFGNLLSGSFTPAGTFASLSVSTSDNRNFLFDLRANDLNALFTNGAFLTSLSVSDTNSGAAADPASVALAPGSWGVSQVGLKANASGPGGSNVWDFDFTYPTAGKDGGAQRLTAFEEVQWTASFNRDTFFNVPAFGIHVQGLTSQQGGSAWYTSQVSPIPEPETYAMLMMGLTVLGFAARRRKDAATALE